MSFFLLFIFCYNITFLLYVVRGKSKMKTVFREKDGVKDSSHHQFFWNVEMTEDSSSHQSQKVWDMSMTPEIEKAIDNILKYFLNNDIKPSPTTIEGTITQIATSLILKMYEVIPSSLKADLTLMLDHICDWLADYAQETSAQKIRLTFGFSEKKSEA